MDSLRSQCLLYEALGLSPQPFQLATLEAYERGLSGLVAVPTGEWQDLGGVGWAVAENAANVEDDC